MEARAHRHRGLGLRWLVGGKSASQDGAFSEELPPRLRCSDGAEAQARTRDWEDEVAINIQASLRGGGGGGGGGKDVEPRGLQQEAAKSRGRRLLSGPLAVALRCPEVPAGLVTPSAGQRPCDVAWYFAGWYLGDAGAASDRYVNIWRVVRHYPLTRVRIPATITSIIHRLSKFDGKWEKKRKKKETTLQVLPGRISCYCSARPQQPLLLPAAATACLTPTHLYTPHLRPACAISKQLPLPWVRAVPLRCCPIKSSPRRQRCKGKMGCCCSGCDKRSARGRHAQRHLETREPALEELLMGTAHNGSSAGLPWVGIALHAPCM